MSIRLIAMTILAVATIGSAAQAPALDDTAILTRSIDGFVRPAYHRLHESASALTATTQALCATPSTAALETARSGFEDAIEAWSSIEIIRFGPVTRENRLERMLFWPDRKGTGLKQVQAAIAAQDATATDATTLAGKSVAMQGFGALEYVLYGTGAETLAAGDAYRCAYGAAIAGNMEAISASLDAEWADAGGFAAEWEHPGPDNPRYHKPGEALGELFAVFVNGLELVRDVRLNGFLGAAPEQDKPKQAVFWRSELTATSLHANMVGMKKLFAVSEITQSLPEESQWLPQSILFEFGNAEKAAHSVTAPVGDALGDPVLRSKLSYFGVVTSSLSDLFGNRLAGELGLTAGFSSLDGD